MSSYMCSAELKMILRCQDVINDELPEGEQEKRIAPESRWNSEVFKNYLKYETPERHL